MTEFVAFECFTIIGDEGRVHDALARFDDGAVFAVAQSGDRNAWAAAGVCIVPGCRFAGGAVGIVAPIASVAWSGDGDEGDAIAAAAARGIDDDGAEKNAGGGRDRGP